MYFIDIESLKQDLKSDSIGSAEQIKYLLALGILISFPHSSAYSGFEKWDGLDWLSWGLDWLVFLVGSWTCFRANGGANGVRFLERWLSLTWVFGLRWLPLGFLLLAGGVALIRLSGVEDVGETVAFRLLVPLIGAVYVWRLCGHFSSLRVAAV